MSESFSPWLGPLDTYKYGEVGVADGIGFGTFTMWGNLGGVNVVVPTGAVARAVLRGWFGKIVRGFELSATQPDSVAVSIKMNTGRGDDDTKASFSMRYNYAQERPGTIS